MAEAKNGDKVQVHYTGKLDDGTVFDSSEGRGPLAFELGAGKVIPGFEAAVVGMQEGETKTTHIPADEAYGQYQQEMVITIPRDQFPPDIEPQAGQQLELRSSNNDTFAVRVKEVTDSAVTLDGNHPLAGENLNFDIRLVEID